MASVSFSREKMPRKAWQRSETRAGLRAANDRTDALKKRGERKCVTACSAPRRLAVDFFCDQQ